MPDIVMPRLSDSMEEGTILQWLKQVGDEVSVGEELVEIETDKANMAYESDVAGTLLEIVAEEGETLPIGSTIARVGGAGEPSKKGRKKQKAAAAEAPAVAEAAGAASPSQHRRWTGEGVSSGSAHGQGEGAGPLPAPGVRARGADREGRRRGGRWPPARGPCTAQLPPARGALRPRRGRRPSRT